MARLDLSSIKEKIMTTDAVLAIISDKDRKLKAASENSKKFLLELQQERLKTQQLTLEFANYKTSNSDYMAKYVQFKEKYDASLKKLTDDNLMLKKQEELCAELKRKVLSLTSTVEALRQTEKNLKNQLEQMGDLRKENEDLKDKLNELNLYRCAPIEKPFAGYSSDNAKEDYLHYLNYIIHTDAIDDDLTFYLTNEMKTLPAVIKPITNPKEFKQKVVVNQGVQCGVRTRINHTQTEITIKSSKHVQTGAEVPTVEMQTQTCKNNWMVNKDVQTDCFDLCKCGGIQSDNVQNSVELCNAENAKVSCDIRLQLDNVGSVIFSKSVEKQPEIQSKTPEQTLGAKTDGSPQTHDDRELKVLVSKQIQTDVIEMKSAMVSAQTQTECMRNISNQSKSSNRGIQTEQESGSIYRRRRMTMQEAVSVLKRAKINITIKAGRILNYRANTERHTEKSKFLNVITKIYKYLSRNENPSTKKRLQLRRNKLCVSSLQRSKAAAMYSTDSETDSSHRPASEYELNSIDSGYIRSDCDGSVVTTKSKSDLSVNCNRKLGFLSEESYAQSVLDEMKPTPEDASIPSDEDEEDVSYILKEMSQEIPLLENYFSPISKAFKRNTFKEDLGPNKKKPKQTASNFGEEIPVEVALDICDNVVSPNTPEEKSKLKCVDEVSISSSRPPSLDSFEHFAQETSDSIEMSLKANTDLTVECRVEDSQRNDITGESHTVLQSVNKITPQSRISTSASDCISVTAKKMLIPLNEDKKYHIKKPAGGRFKKIKQNLIKSNKAMIVPIDKIPDSNEEVVVCKKRVALLPKESLHLGSIVSDKEVLDKLKGNDDLNEKSRNKLGNGVKVDISINGTQVANVKTSPDPNNLCKNQTFVDKLPSSASDEIAAERKVQKKFKRPTRLSAKAAIKELRIGEDTEESGNLPHLNLSDGSLKTEESPLLEQDIANKIENAKIPDEGGGLREEKTDVGNQRDLVQVDPCSSNIISKGKHKNSIWNESKTPDVGENKQNKKKSVLNWQYVLKIFRGLIHFRGESSKVQQSIRHLQKLDRETFLDYVLRMVRSDNTEPERPENPFEPHLTITQKVMLGLLLTFENQQIFVETTEEFLSICERWLLFNEHDPVGVQKVTRLYAAICKMKKDKRRLRRMFCDALYFMGDLALPFVYHVLVSWIQVLPVEPQDSDLSGKPLIQVLVQVVHINGCKNPDYFVTVLKNLLTVYYKYPKERYDENALMKQFLEKYICSLDENFEMAILILCKQYKGQWCCKQFELMRQLMLVAGTREICTALVGLMKKISEQFQNDPATVNKIQTLLNTVYNDFSNFNLVEVTPKN